MPDDLRELPAPKEGLSVDFVTVEELYAGHITFHLPWFQRAYAWSDDMAQRLLNDIHLAFAQSAQRYFIGHVLLARKAGEKRHVLVDGQQRAVTLMILFALLRHKLAGTPWEDRITPLLQAGAGPDGPHYRLKPQPTIERFLHEHIQSPGAVATPVDDFAASEVENNILSNRARLNERLDEFIDEGMIVSDFAEFLLTRCLLVLEIIENEADNEAWKMLQTEEDTGLPFHHGARAKVTLIEAMPVADREAAGKEWDRCQARLGDNGMQQLVQHIRDLSGRYRSSQPVEKDIVTRFRLHTGGLGFVRNQLVPSAHRLLALRERSVGAGPQRIEIARYIRHMEWAGHAYWCPAAMRWLEQRGETDAETVAFFRRLARKVWLLRISGADSVEYERRFISLSNEISDGLAVDDMPELAVSQKWSGKTRENLLSRTFYDKRYSRPVLRYLSDLCGRDPGEIDGDGVTIEHVLPRNPGKNSQWVEDFGSIANITDHAHRIGNLALLSFKDNQAVGNQEYAVKREILAASGFILSADAAEAAQWTPEHVVARGNRLVRVLFDHWQVPF